MEQLDISNNKIIIIVLVFIIIAFICIYFFTRNNLNDEYNEIENYEIIENITEEEPVDMQEILVHVTGAVKREGIVRLKEGARIADAIEAAGGVTEKTNIGQVNLAYEVEDGQKIYIPSIDDKKEEGVEKIIEKEYVTSEPGDEVVFEEESNNNKNDKININTADLIELQEIPGVGEATAQKIISYREENGKFKNIEDIKNVKGIGDSKFEDMKENICIK